MVVTLVPKPPKLSPYWIHNPTPRLMAFLLLETQEALFGGAAGGGKTDALLMAALQYVDEPDYAATHVDLGLALAGNGDLDAALESYRNALEIQPNLAEAHCRLGLALQEKGRLVEALVALQKGHELGEGKPGWTLPSDEWIDECWRLMMIEARRDGRQG